MMSLAPDSFNGLVYMCTIIDTVYLILGLIFQSPNLGFLDCYIHSKYHIACCLDHYILDNQQSPTTQ